MLYVDMSILLSGYRGTCGKSLRVQYRVLHTHTSSRTCIDLMEEIMNDLANEYRCGVMKVQDCKRCYLTERETTSGLYLFFFTYFFYHASVIFIHDYYIRYHS